MPRVWYWRCIPWIITRPILLNLYYHFSSKISFVDSLNIAGKLVEDAVHAGRCFCLFLCIVNENNSSDTAKRCYVGTISCFARYVMLHWNWSRTRVVFIYNRYDKRKRHFGQYVLYPWLTFQQWIQWQYTRTHAYCSGITFPRYGIPIRAETARGLKPSG